MIPNSFNQNLHLPPSLSIFNQLTGVEAGPANVISHCYFCSSFEDTPNLTHDLDSDRKSTLYATFMATLDPQQSGFLSLDYPGYPPQARSFLYPTSTEIGKAGQDFSQTSIHRVGSWRCLVSGQGVLRFCSEQEHKDIVDSACSAISSVIRRSRASICSVR